VALASLAALGAAVLATPALAAESESDYNRFEFTPFAGYMTGGEFEDPTDSSDRDLDEGTNLGLIVDIAAESWRHYEILLANMDTEVEGTTPFDMGVQYLQIGGIVSHPTARSVIPYFGMTIGATRFSPDQAGLDDETKFSFTAGGGLRIPITDHFGVRFDARAFVTVLDSEGDLFCVSTGGAATCNIRAKSDTFLQYAASLGVVIGF
jgi:opacity protein-like surface antigen